MDNMWHILDYSYICVIVQTQDCLSHLWLHATYVLFSTSQQLLMPHLMFHTICYNQNLIIQMSYLVILKIK